MIGSSNDETNFPHKLLLTDTQVSKICKAFANGSTANVNILKTQLSKMSQSGRFSLYEITGPQLKRMYSMPKIINNKLENFLKQEEKIYDARKTVGNSIKGIKTFFRPWTTLTNSEINHIMKVIKSLENRVTLLKETTRIITRFDWGFSNFLRPSMTTGLPLMKSLLTPLAKSGLLLLGLSAGISAADASIQKKIFGSGSTALIISNEGMEEIIKIVKSLEEARLLINGISEIIKN